MIENGIARFDIAQKIYKRNVVSLGARERAHDEVKISGGEARPTIRPDHRGRIMRNRCVYGKPKRCSVSVSMIVSALNWPSG
jgi:actin-like ATPase involved in cell morphogenesis